MKGIATFCYDRRRFVLAGWLGFLAALVGLFLLFKGEYKTEFRLPGSESQAAVDLLQERGVNERTGFFGQVVFRATQGVDDPAVRARMEELFAAIERDVQDVEVVSPYDEANAYQISDDGTIAYAEINFGDRSNEQ